ncbi:Type-2Aa cytolytic delta-endotoxin [Streptomyces sp. NPDC090025]|uniref:Type-2Aa cytolytic delta-endotoxin n=1 Tax=Streptomyces sp. NPDC090025 TaxID=3365922 RepID=UPI003837D5EC
MAASFKTVIEVDPAHRTQAEALAHAFQEAIAPATVNYDFEHIRAAAAALPDATIVRMVRGWGLQEQAPVLVMVLSLKEAVRQALPPEAAEAGFWGTVERELVAAFTGLAEQEAAPGGAPGLSYYEEGADRTRYYRDLFFALQDPETGAYLHAIAFCVDVTVHRDKAGVGALAMTDIVPFALRLNAIVVRQELAASPVTA